MILVMEEDWAQKWDIAGAAAYIAGRGYTTVALQFPDELLNEAAAVSRALQDACTAAGQEIQAFVMADTSYNSLGVDEVAAQHASAHCVIHYGRASLSPLSRLPAYFVFTRAPLVAAAAAASIAGWAASQQGHGSLQGKKAVLALPDLALTWAVPDLRDCLAAAAAQAGLDLPFVVADVPARWLDPVGTKHAAQAGSTARSHAGSALANEGAQAPGEDSAAGIPGDVAPTPLPQNASCHAAGLTWQLPEGIEAGDCLWLWLGADDAPALTELLMTHSREQWALLDPQSGCVREGVPQDILRTLRKRNYLVEKARNANIVGIVVGTLGVAGYLQAAEEVRRLARRAGKRTYTLLMGKPSPAKLANFPEADIFVMLADAQGQILDSKEFYAPIITPFEAQLAFVPEGAAAAAQARYSLGFDELLSAAGASTDTTDAYGEAPRFSLLDGSYHGGESESGDPGRASSALAERAGRSLGIHAGPGKLAEVRSAAEFLDARRTFRGLETPYTGAAVKPVVLAVEGRSGRAASYEDEPQTRL